MPSCSLTLGFGFGAGGGSEGKVCVPAELLMLLGGEPGTVGSICEDY